MLPFINVDSLVVIDFFFGRLKVSWSYYEPDLFPLAMTTTSWKFGTHIFNLAVVLCQLQRLLAEPTQHVTWYLDVVGASVAYSFYFGAGFLLHGRVFCHRHALGVGFLISTFFSGTAY